MMNLSDNDLVQRLIADHGRLCVIASKLENVNPNSRHVLFATGYFNDTLLKVEIDPFPTDADLSARLAVGIAGSIKALVADELKAIRAKLFALGVDWEK